MDRPKRPQHWTMANGRAIEIREMTDPHVINAIRLLERGAQQQRDERPFPWFQGELVQYQAEQEWMAAGFGYWSEHDERNIPELAQALNPCYEALVAEAHRRGLVWS